MKSGLLAKQYEPHDVEKRWYRLWEKNRLFEASEESADRNYSIVIPPPNVTGVLHMGHALNNTLQDILCRYRRLRGDNVLWMPGTDHAGIATQNVVEKKLAVEGLDRHQLGREKFIEAVWKWRKEYGSAIIHQLKRLGASCDWKRERFTMDEGLSTAVRKVFVQLYNEKLIYRGNYIINWCHRCHTALADLEVEHEMHDGHLYHIRYPFADGSKGVVVATTRPETMLGDTAVAVHPDDDRYFDIGSRMLILPLMNREIPIVKDRYVDKLFGTGALKVTPAHDANDFEIGGRHQLQCIKVIGDDGKMTSEAGRYVGLDRFDCREAVIEALKKEGILEKIEPHQHNIGHCYRCKTVIEPNLSKQWFIKTRPLAEKAIAAVKTGDTRIVPEMWVKTYFEWMNNIKDWCISRQIWWGHQIPAWTCQKCEEMIVAMDKPKGCFKCGGDDLVQETDVLDTWFSSSLWPFSTMGWPEETPLLKLFYPTSVLVTGFDILFFWVARMMMMGLHFMKEVPFKDVYVHALVRDEAGKKMSKSTGNVIDPITVIKKYGTDAFRFTLAAFAAQGRDIKMSEKRVEGYRHFVNKLWNAARFSLMHIDEDVREPDLNRLSLPDKWILSTMNRTAKTVGAALDSYRFNDAAGTLYQFVWHELCDWYLEMIKPDLYRNVDSDIKRSTVNVLWYVLRETLIMLHPFIPFITEEIWHQMPGVKGSVMKALFPGDDSGDASGFLDDQAESEMKVITQIISGIRNIRGEIGLAPTLFFDVTVQTKDEAKEKILQQHRDIIQNMAKLNSFSVQRQVKRPKGAATAIVDGATIFASLEGIIDFAKEAERFEKEIRKLTDELIGLSNKLNNDDFLKKAPAHVVDRVKGKQKILLEKEQKLRTNLSRIKEAQA